MNIKRIMENRRICDMAFTPRKKGGDKDKIRKAFMEGYVLRCNAIDEDPIEVMDRDAIRDLRHMGNIGGEFWNKKYLVDQIYCSHKLLYEVRTELEEEYSVKKVSCQSSGCCQYSTYGYYLD